MQQPPATTEIDRLNSEATRHRMVGDFLDWLNENGFSVCEMVAQKGWGSSPYLPTPLSMEQLLARYLDIDLNKVEAERRAYLEWFRSVSTESKVA